MYSDKKNYKINQLLRDSERNRIFLLNKLRSHDVYHNLRDIQDVRLFMESHVFAVWDFMSLLKSLQNNLTSVTVPWLPKKNAKLTKFINEIVHIEESDLDNNNIPKSHFSMYLDSMDEVGADRNNIDDLLLSIEGGQTVEDVLSRLKIDARIKKFVNYTFKIINTSKSHLIASSFTYGREDVIPEIFINLVEELDSKNNKYSAFKYYLERHIEIDGDTHGPIALEMMHDLCGNDLDKWTEALACGEESLKHRIELWDAINSTIKLKNKSNGKFKDSFIYSNTPALTI